MDLSPDGGTNSNEAIDKTVFGMMIGLGEIGKVGFANAKVRDTIAAGIVEKEVPLLYLANTAAVGRIKCWKKPT